MSALLQHLRRRAALLLALALLAFAAAKPAVADRGRSVAVLVAAAATRSATKNGARPQQVVSRHVVQNGTFERPTLARLAAPSREHPHRFETPARDERDLYLSNCRLLC